MPETQICELCQKEVPRTITCTISASSFPHGFKAELEICGTCYRDEFNMIVQEIRDQTARDHLNFTGVENG